MDYLNTLLDSASALVAAHREIALVVVGALGASSTWLLIDALVKPEPRLCMTTGQFLSLLDECQMGAKVSRPRDRRGVKGLSPYKVEVSWSSAAIREFMRIVGVDVAEAA